MVIGSSFNDPRVNQLTSGTAPAVKDSSSEVKDKVSRGGNETSDLGLINPSLLKNAGSQSAETPSVQTKTEEKQTRQSGNITTLSLVDGELVGRSVSQRTGANDQYLLRDGFDSSRDIVGVSAQEGKPTEPYTFKVQLKDLQPGAEISNMDMYLLISVGQNGKVTLPDDIPGTSQPWNLAVGAYDSKNFNVYDEKGSVDKSVLKDLKFDSLHDSVEFSLDKNILRSKGWQDGQPVKLQPFTTKDFQKQVTDSLDEPFSKPWSNGGKLSAFAETKSLSDPKLSDWRDEHIYMILTDRMTPKVKAELHEFHGGDIQGVIDKVLPHMKDIGATALWITNVQENQEKFVNSYGYHYYWPTDQFKVDPHLGDMDKFKEMVEKAHKDGIKVVYDIPFNHVAWEHPLRTDPEKFLKTVQGMKDIPEELKPKSVEDLKGWIHNKPDISNWDDPVEAETGSMFGLPDLAQENPQVSAYLKAVAKFWIDTGIDGFRLDAVKNIHKPFFEDFDKFVHDYAGKDFFMVGECFDTSLNKLNSYQQRDMDSLFDYPLYFTTNEVIAKDGSMKALAGKLKEGDDTYLYPDKMSVFLDNHDTGRIMSQAGGNPEKAKLAITFAMTVDRIPTTYYGTEVGMDGTPPPGENVGWPETSRKDMEWGANPDFQKYFANVSNLRKDSIALKEGKRLEMWVDDQVFCFGRSHPEQEAVVVLNNSYDNQTRDIPVRPEQNIPNGTVLKDAISGREVVVKDGKIHSETKGKGAQIFLPVK